MKSNFAKMLFGTLLFLTAAGCNVTGKGNVDVYVSKYDNLTRHEMSPAFVSTVEPSFGRMLTDFELGAFYVTGEQTESLFFVVLMNEIATIESLGINIDGTRHEFKSNSLTQREIDFDYGLSGSIYSTSMKKFKVPVSIVQDMLDAESVIIRVNTSNEYMEGDFKYDCELEGLYNDYACHSFMRFNASYLK